MNHEDLFEAIGSADERMLEKSEHKSHHWEKGFLAAVAACLAVAIMAGLFFLPRRGGDRPLDNIGATQSNSTQDDGRYLRIHLNNETSEAELGRYVGPDTVVVGDILESHPTQLPIYQIKERTITEEEFQQVMERLEIPENPSHRPQWKLEGNEISGQFAYLTDGQFTKSDEELEEMARKAFEQFGLLTGEYEYTGIWSSGERVEIGENGSEEIITLINVGVSFCRVVDGMRIIDSDVCNIYFNDDGIVRFRLELYEYEPVGTMDLVSMEEAWDRIKTPDRFSIEGEPDCAGPAKTLAVEEVVMVYCNQYYRGCTILQPVYRFKGTATFEDGTQAPFTSSVIAIPDSMTWVDESYIP